MTLHRGRTVNWMLESPITQMCLRTLIRIDRGVRPHLIEQKTYHQRRLRSRRASTFNTAKCNVQKVRIPLMEKRYNIKRRRQNLYHAIKSQPAQRETLVYFSPEREGTGALTHAMNCPINFKLSPLVLCISKSRTTPASPAKAHDHTEAS